MDVGTYEPVIVATDGEGIAIDEDTYEGTEEDIEHPSIQRKREIQELIDTQVKWQTLLVEGWEEIEREKKEIEKEKENIKYEKQEIEKQKEDIERERADIRRERGEIEKERERVHRGEPDTKRAKLATPTGRIKLDVGGKSFSTSIATLRGFNNPTIKSFIAGSWQDNLEPDGTFFIDRDPMVFNHVLNFMRGIDLALEELTPLERLQLEKDAEFYDVPSLLSKIHPAWTMFPYSGQPVYDNKGIIYYLATRGGKRAWANPTTTNQITITTSGLHCGSASALVGNQLMNFGVNNGPDNWVCIDLQGQLVRPRAYMLSHSSDIDGYYYLRHWQLQGSMDGTIWTTLRTHENDT
eukprot:Ihof_evm11s5 gene=Ihof_evmTU11s5